MTYHVHSPLCPPALAPAAHNPVRAMVISLVALSFVCLLSMMAILFLIGPRMNPPAQEDPQLANLTGIEKLQLHEAEKRKEQEELEQSSK